MGFRILVVFVIAITLGAGWGCAQTRGTDETGPGNVRIPFIRDGVTSRLDVESRLGDPLSTYEDSRIVTYVMTGDPLRNIAPDVLDMTARVRADGALHQLVLVFDMHEHHDARRHLAEVWRSKRPASG